jgi:hypothetical protein
MASYRELRNIALTERQNWMAAFEDAVVELSPQLAGKIDWDTAAYFFNQRFSVTLAAERYVTSKED